MSGFLDTNIVVRYLTRDDAELAARAGEIIETAEDLILTESVLGEIGFVLTGFYGVERQDAVDALIGLVQRTNVRPFHLSTDQAVQALMLCRPSGRVSFIDTFLWAIARSSDTRAVYTFDECFPDQGITVRRQ